MRITTVDGGRGGPSSSSSDTTYGSVSIVDGGRAVEYSVVPEESAQGATQETFTYVITDENGNTSNTATVVVSLTSD